jgi:hypothetical protein
MGDQPFPESVINMGQNTQVAYSADQGHLTVRKKTLKIAQKSSQTTVIDPGKLISTGITITDYRKREATSSKLYFDWST